MSKPKFRIELVLALVIALATGAFIFYKVHFLGYTMATIRPEKGYFVRLLLDVEGNGREANIEVALPIQSGRQHLRQEQQSSGAFRYAITTGREARWVAKNLSGKHRITYSFFAQTEAKDYALPQGTLLPVTYPARFRDHLQSSERIQSEAAEILAKARELMPDGTDLAQALKNTYDFVYKGITYEKVRGPTDALSALRLGEASCNGKNRLMVALLRARGIPARMAKGLILQNTNKRTTHAWTEALVGNEWVPFCPTSGYFARIPEHYLELAKGDRPAFSHNKHIKFDWKWVIQPQVNHTEQAVLSNVTNPLNILNHWVSMKDFHIPLRLIMIVLLVPIAGTVISVSRNLVGLVPFGTFMPALIAVSFQDTGFLLGSTLFLSVILVTSAVNFGLVRLRLLHIPRLVIVLTLVVITLMVASILCVKMNLAKGASVSLFPMAILTLTSERFSQTILEDGWKEAAKRMLITYTVSCACYCVISRSALQIFIVAFPELLLLNIALNLVIGCWSGLRLLEYARFRLVPPPPMVLPKYA